MQGTATELAGDESVVDQIAQTLGAEYSQSLGKSLEKQAGPEMTVMFRWFQNVGYHANVTALREELPSLIGFQRWRNTY